MQSGPSRSGRQASIWAELFGWTVFALFTLGVLRLRRRLDEPNREP